MDLNRFLKTGDDELACSQVKDVMTEYGVLIIRDPRVDIGLPNRYRDMMQDFYRLPVEIKSKYVQTPLADGTQIYETGWRPPFTEKPRRRDEVLHLIPEGARPSAPPPADPKERYMLPVGARPETSEFPDIDFLSRIDPVEIENWVPICDAWGVAMSSALKSVMEMLALGFREPVDLFTNMLFEGVQKLAPTGLDLYRHGKSGTVAAGFHNDLSAVTMHGRSNYPGLWAYTRGWKRFPVRLPDDDCLLLQSGRVLEHLTAGRTLRGYHEVVIGEEAQIRIREELLVGKIPWRVSTTMFSNIRTDRYIEPIGRFVNEPEAARYFAEREKCGTRMMRTLTEKVVKLTV
ncbi:2-oxoglutarate and iron-dependent oxygenase domain-containing protein [Candidatus Uhrbacteria bacterium]|nr:2-oxoglutarate and iron-dependent oxygenase domain-containing protein [Candidatus Uhrbacteria bacterium]